MVPRQDLRSSVVVSSPGAQSEAEHEPLARNSGRWATWLALAIVVLPVLAAVCSLIGRTWIPSGDQALEVLRIGDVGGSHTPLVGAWSRWGWSHPGPLLFWVLAPFTWLFGNIGVLIGCGVLTMASCAGTVLIARRTGGLALAALTSATLALLVMSSGLELTLNPWNPYAAFFPFFLYLFLIWAICCDDFIMVPVAVVVGTFCVQAHIGFLPVIVAGGFLAVTVMIFRRLAARYAPAHADHSSGVCSDRDDGGLGDADPETTWSAGGAEAVALAQRAPGWLRSHQVSATFAASAALGFLLWTPALLQQLTQDPGNMSALLFYMRHPEEVSAGFAVALGIMGAQFRFPAPWMGASETGALGFSLLSSKVYAAIGVGLIVVATVWSWRRRFQRVALLGVVALVEVVAAVVATSRITGIVQPYMIRWWWAVAAIATITVLWGSICLLGWSEKPRLLQALLLAGFSIAAITMVRDLPVEVPLPDVSAALDQVAEPTASALQPGRRYIVESFDARYWFSTGHGLLLALEALGADVLPRVSGLTDQEYGSLTDLQYGSWRVEPTTGTEGVVSVINLEDLDAGLPPPPRSREVARWDPLTPSERAELRALEQAARQAMGASAVEGALFLQSPISVSTALKGGATQSQVDRIRELQERSFGLVVFVSEPDTP